MFQFRGLASLRMLVLLTNGLSHSDILGSILVCKSPRLFAAYHVLLRLQEPRHPPCALFYFLTTSNSPIILLESISHSLNHVNERCKLKVYLRTASQFRSATPEVMLLKLSLKHQAAYLWRLAPERRCSSRTFRYGYLVTT